jgi:hypothetical protein
MRAVLLAMPTVATFTVFSLEQARKPWLKRCAPSDHLHDRRGAYDEQTSKVSIPLLADAAEALLSDGVARSRRQTEPCRELPV